MNKIKLFWCHPRLMDYRIPFFDLVNQYYDLKLLFQIRSDLTNNYTSIIAKSVSEGKLLRRFLHPHDMLEIVRNIKNSDIFISSFLLNPFSKFGILIAKVCNKRVIIWEEVFYFQKGLRGKIKYLQMRLIAKFVDAFLIMGEPQKKALNTLGVNEKKIFMANEYPGLVYTDIKEKKIKTLDLDGKRYILSIGRLVPMKGIEYLIKAFKLLNKEVDDIYLVIVGDGVLKEDLMQLARPNKNILFHPSVL